MSHGPPASPAYSTDKPTILIVEDEHDLAELLEHHLTREGYKIAWAASGERALDLAATERPGLVLLDLMLPGIDGLEVCRHLQKQAQTRELPVIILSAKGEEADVVSGLELGADDYVTKPFSPRVLVARVKAVLRRRREAAAHAERSDRSVVEVGPLVLKIDRHEATVSGRELELTAGEFRLLTMLAMKPGRVFTRRQIIESVQGNLSAVTDRSVDVQVVGLRRKLGELGPWIKTVRAVGYRFEPVGVEVD